MKIYIQERLIRVLNALEVKNGIADDDLKYDTKT